MNGFWHKPPPCPIPTSMLFSERPQREPTAGLNKAGQLHLGRDRTKQGRWPFSTSWKAKGRWLLPERQRNYWLTTSESVSSLPKRSPPTGTE